MMTILKDKTNTFKALPVALSLLFCCALCPSSAPALEDAPQQSLTLDELGSQIHTSLESLKQQSKDLTRELQERSSEVAELKTNLNELTICLDNTNQLLADYETKLIRYEEKLKFWKKVCMTVFGVLMAMLLVTGVVLYLELTKKTDFI